MAWIDIDDRLKAALVEVRCKKGVERQSDLSEDFTKLKSLLDQRSKHPFDDFDDSLREELNNCSTIFKEGCHWKTADLSDNRYFYRIETLESFLKKHATSFHTDAETDDVIILSAQTDSPEKKFDKIIKAYSKNRGWQQLSKLTHTYCSRRGFSWWTNYFVFEYEGHFPDTFYGNGLTLENKWLLNFAFKVGICSDWLSENMLFLRLDSSKIDKDNIRIPSIIDAFQQPVFFPREFHQDERWGLAYDLDQSFKPCSREYVIKHIPVDAIEYIPVRINLATVDKVNPNARLGESLVKTLIDNI